MIIWKFTLLLTDSQEVMMPLNAKILCVQERDDYLQIWAMVDETKTLQEPRTFEVYGTGQRIRLEINDIDIVYIGTVQMKATSTLVWHVFERIG